MQVTGAASSAEIQELKLRDLDVEQRDKIILMEK